MQYAQFSGIFAGHFVKHFHNYYFSNLAFVGTELFHYCKVQVSRKFVHVLKDKVMIVIAVASNY